jgi:cytochrome c
MHPRFRNILRLLPGLLLATGLHQAYAADGATLYKQKTCIACHGPDGGKPLMPDYPKLAGQNAAYLVRQMQDIKSGARANGNAAAMKGIMHLVNDEEMQAIADWLAGLK